MNKLIKFFPLMPQPKESGKLVGAIFFYVFVPNIVALILSGIWTIFAVILSAAIGFLLGLTVVLAPLAVVVGFILGLPGLLIGLLGFAYMVMGIIFAILSYNGREFN